MTLAPLSTLAVELEQPVFDAHRCVRGAQLRALRRPCTDCVAACPKGAISIETSEPMSGVRQASGGRPRIDPDRCDGCALCLSACSSGAFSGALSKREDLVAAWRRLEADAASSSAIKPAGSPEIQARFAVSCALSRPEGQRVALGVMCIAGFGWENLVIPGLLGARGVDVYCGDCETCARGRVARPMMIRGIPLAKKIARALGLGSVRVHTRDCSIANRSSAAADGASRPVLSRREAFSAVFRRGRAVTGQLAEQVATQVVSGVVGSERPDPHQPHGVAAAVEDRDMLAGLIGRSRAAVARWSRTLDDPSDVRKSRHLPTADRRACARPASLGRRLGGRGLAGSPSVDLERCTGCHLCAIACPTGALEVRAERAGAPEVLIHPQRCTSCDRCAQACTPDALKVAPVLQLADWDGTPKVLIASRTVACRVCGSPAISLLVPRCARCHRERRAVARTEPVNPSCAVLGPKPTEAAERP